MLLSGCQNNRYCVVIALAVMVCALFACHPYVPPLPEAPKLPARIRDACDPRITATKEALRGRGIQVIEMGQMHLLSVPADILFPDQSPRLTWDSYNTLNCIVCYMRAYRKIKTTITTFANLYVSFSRAKALTKARSEAVAHYLWTQDVKSQMIITRGQGSEKPIVVSPMGGDHGMNSRVEISFREEI